MKKYYLLISGIILGLLSTDSNAQKMFMGQWKKSPFEHQVFVRNIQQFESEKSLGEDFRYYANPNGIDVFFKNTGISYIYRELPKVSEQEREMYEHMSQDEMFAKLPKPIIHQFNINWIGSNINPEIIEEEKQNFYYTYSQPADMNKNLKADCFKKITYKNVYPNIDVEYILPEKGGIKYSLIVHPGGDINKIKYEYSGSKLTTVDAFGNIHLESAFGEFIEYAPLTFLSNSKEEIKSSFKIEKNIVSFQVSEYDASQSLTIDPWINNPNFTTKNQAYDVNFDLEGNVYAHGSMWPYKLVKYNANGTLLWQYNCPGVFGNVNGANPTYGDFAVDEISQSVYIGEGFDQSFLNVIKLNKQGTVLATYPGTCSSNMNEIWRMEYNRCVNKVVIGGGGTGTVRNQFATMDTVLGTNAITPYNPLNATEALHDISLLAFDPTGNYFFGATVRSTLNPLNYDNRLLKLPSTTIIPSSFSVYDTYTFQEGQTQSGFTWQNGQFACGFNGLACGQQYVYLYDGNKLQQRSKTTGALVNQVLTSGVALGCAGITIDPCENIYVAANSAVEVYDINLNLINTYTTNNAIYDLKLGPGGILYFAGEGQIGTISVTNSAPSVTGTSTPNTSCTSACNGTATINISCGNPSNYTFAWSGGQNTQSVTGLCAGTYTVIVSTACVFIDTVVITVGFNPLYPTVNANAPLALNCAVTSGNISVNATPAGVTYSWSGPGIVSGGTTFSPIVNAPGTYTVVVTIPGTGCTSTTTVNVTQNITLPDVTANPGFMLTCTNTSGSISANSNTSGINWSWAGPGIVSGGTTNNPLVNAPGTYTVTVTNPINLCTKTGTVVVTNDNSIPNLTAGPPFTLNCLILSGTINASSTTANVSYNWSGPGITSGGTTSSPTINQPGNYTVIVTDPISGCTTVGSVLVTNDNTPPTVSANSGPVLTCVNTSDTISVTSTTGGVTYVWSGTGIVSGGTTPNIIVNAPGTYTVIVTDPSNGCTTTAIVTATINITPPNITAGAPLTLTCVVTSDTINATSTTPNVTYNWSGPGIVSGGTTNSPLVNSPGTYTVVVTNPVNGCTSSTTVVVNQNITPPNVTVGGTVTLTCSATSYPISASSTTPGAYFNWAGPGILTGGTTANPIINATGTYTVTVTDPINGCTSTATILVVSNVAAPAVVAGNAAILTCLITSTTINASSPANGATYSWAGPGIVSGGNSSTPTINQSGIYTVTVTDPATGCTNTATVLVTDAILPTATAASSATIILGNSTTLIATGGPSYSWSPTTGLSCTTCASPVATPTVTTVYCVTVTDQYGCKDSACVTIAVFDPCPPSLKEFPIPNVFSPNDDGKNDLFFLEGWDDECIQEFNVEIYDRWGLKMFESIGSNVHWDGRTSSGLITPAGTYYYVLTVKKIRAQPIVYKGFLTLVR